MSTHAKLSPSAASRWMACPGSVALSEGIPDVSSPAAEEGTYAHSIAARCLEEGLFAADLLGETDGTYTVDEEMAEYVQQYLDVVWGLPGPVQIERRVTLSGICDEIYGTADAIVPAGDTLHVLDLKYGRGVRVFAERNPQLMIYGVGALLEHGVDFREVVLHIVQPRHEQGGHHFERTTPGILSRWATDELAPAAKATRAKNPCLVTGEHCRFCRAKAICPALRDKALQHTRELFAAEDFKVPAKIPPSPGALSVQQIGEALDAFPIIEEWMRAVRSHAYDLANNGEEIPGYKLVAKKRNRVWSDPKDAAEKLAAILPEGKTPWTDPKIISPAEAERRVGKANKGILEPLIRRPETGTALVPLSDKRPAYNPVDVFEITPPEDEADKKGVCNA